MLFSALNLVSLPNWKQGSIYNLEVKIADYDFARRFTVCGPEESTASMSMLGTLIYAAPEIRDSWGKAAAAKYTESADIFSLGVMCYRIVKGIKVEIRGKATATTIFL